MPPPSSPDGPITEHFPNSTLSLPSLLFNWTLKAGMPGQPCQTLSILGAFQEPLARSQGLRQKLSALNGIASGARYPRLFSQLL